MIVRGGYKESVSKKLYYSTGKEPTPRVTVRGEEAYWVLSQRVGEKFGEEGVTVADIYHEITGPMGLSSSDTIQVVKNAKMAGYLR